ncbi:MAG: hypothetical protein B7W98_02845, partial [Parcubacteria group bacterium 20-58-5]
KVLGIFVGAPENLRCREWFEAIGPVSYRSIQSGNAEIQRWAAFLELSNQSEAWLIGSRNRTEEYTGLYSLASRVATFLPLAKVWKSQVMTLCNLIGVPDAITASSRHADPDCGRPQEMAEIPLEKFDAYLQRHNGECTESVLAAYKTLSEGPITYLERVVAQNRFKQLLPNKGPAIFPA